MTEKPSANSDRLTGLQRSGKSDAVPNAGDKAPSIPSGAFAKAGVPQTSHPTSSTARSESSSWMPWLGAGMGVVFTVLVTAVLVLRFTGTEFVQTTDSALSAAPESETTSDSDLTPALSIFDRPSELTALVNDVTGSTVLLVCESGDSQGSGFAFDLIELTGASDLIVVTNHHVVDGCLNGQPVGVFTNSETLSGTVISWDKDLDVAALTVPGLAIKPLSLGEEPQVGQWVMAVGAPEGLQNTVSFGFVTNIVPSESMITSDAVIGPGSSGGPLVDNQGNVIGVNFAVLSADASGISLSSTLSAMCRKVVTC